MATAPRRIVVAINPQASFGARHEVGSLVVSELGLAGFEVVALREPDAETLARSAAAILEDGVEALVVVGGDGMVHLGANLVARTHIPLGIVPSGTGNDMARGLGIPLDDTNEAVARILSALEGGPRTIDAGRVTSADTVTWFASALSAGFDAVVNERANRMKRPRGKSRYSLAILRELATFRPLEYQVSIDGGAPSAVRAMLISVANNGSIGGGMRIVPSFELDDGAFDLFVVDPMSRLAFLRLLPSVFSGKHVSDPRVHITRVNRVSLSSPGLIAYADGERIGPLPVEAEIVSGALRILA